MIYEGIYARERSSKSDVSGLHFPNNSDLNNHKGINTGEVAEPGHRT